jgi:hypothetical protein
MTFGIDCLQEMTLKRVPLRETIFDILLQRSSNAGEVTEGDCFPKMYFYSELTN